MSEKPIMHGRDHRPGGDDPIPGLGGSSLAAAYLWNIQGSTLTVPTGSVSTRVTWAHFQTTDSTVFATDPSSGTWPGPYNNAAGDSFIYLNKDGAYLAVGMCQFASSGAYEQAMLMDATGFQWDLDLLTVPTSFEEIPTNAGPSLVSSQYGLFSHKMFYVDSSTEPGITSMVVGQGSGSDKTLTGATMGVYYFGDAGDLSRIY